MQYKCINSHATSIQPASQAGHLHVLSSRWGIWGIWAPLCACEFIAPLCSAHMLLLTPSQVGTHPCPPPHPHTPWQVSAVKKTLMSVPLPAPMTVMATELSVSTPWEDTSAGVKLALLATALTVKVWAARQHWWYILEAYLILGINRSAKDNFCVSVSLCGNIIIEPSKGY